MRSIGRLTLMAGLLVAASARAEAPVVQSCEVPAYLLASESTLPKVAAVVKPGGKLNPQIEDAPGRYVRMR